MPRKNPNYHDWIKRHTHCQTCGKYSDIGLDPSHVKSRGAGGGDERNLVAQDRRCHQEYHRLGLTLFNAAYRVDMRRIADENWNTWRVLQSNPTRTTVEQSPSEVRESEGIPDEGINGLSGSGEVDLYQREIKAAEGRSRSRLDMVQKAKKGGHHGKV